MEIYEILKKDHQKVKTLLGKLVSFSEADNDQWKVVVDLIAEDLIPHSRAEEAVLYNSMRDSEDAKSRVMHSYAEHMEAEALLRSLQVMKAIDVNFKAAALKLKESLDHHVQEEESETFTKAKAMFTHEEAVKMGRAFKEMKAVVKDESALGKTWDMIANMMPPRLLKAFKGFSFAHGSRDTQWVHGR